MERAIKPRSRLFHCYGFGQKAEAKTKLNYLCRVGFLTCRRDVSHGDSHISPRNRRLTIDPVTIDS